MKIIIKESQYVYLLENLEKNKKFLNNVMGVDFTDKIQQITSHWDVPMEFDRYISTQQIKRYLNKYGPMYLFELNGQKYLYQDLDGEEIFIGEDAHVYTDIPKQLGIYEMGLRFSDIIDMYFNEEEDI